MTRNLKVCKTKSCKGENPAQALATIINKSEVSEKAFYRASDMGCILGVESLERAHSFNQLMKNCPGDDKFY